MIAAWEQPLLPDKDQSQGVTFIELIVVLAVIAILATLAVPQFLSLVQNNRLSGTAENLYYSLQNARSEAIKRNATIYVSFQTGDTWCYGINTGSACNCAVPTGCDLGTVSAPASQQISFSTTGLTSNTLQFEGTHGAANASGSITMTLYGQSTLITVSVGRLGNLQMCSTGISGYIGC